MSTFLRGFIEKYGKESINTLTKFPSILTLHGLGNRGVLTNELTTPVAGELLYGSEKIDGTNVRVNFFPDGSFLIGSRDNIIHGSGDLYYDNPTVINALYQRIDFKRVCDALFNELPDSQMLTMYGELYGGRIGSNSKQYGDALTGFRMFDVAAYGSELGDLLSMQPTQLSLWREHEEEGKGLVYGQPYVDVDTLLRLSSVSGVATVPYLPVAFPVDLSHQSIWDCLTSALPETLVALTDTAMKRPEGMVFRSANRQHIVKLRFEDYARTLNNMLPKSFKK